MYHRVFSTHLEQVVLAVHTAQLIVNGGYKKSEPKRLAKVSSSYHLCVECLSQLSFDSEVYTKLATAADFVYTFEPNESCEKHLTER